MGSIGDSVTSVGDLYPMMTLKWSVASRVADVAGSARKSARRTSAVISNRSTMQKPTLE
jgi:hypothetical protein